METDGSIALRITRGGARDLTYVVGCRNSLALQRPAVQRGCHDARVSDARLVLVSVVPVSWLVNGSGGFPSSIGRMLQEFAADTRVTEGILDGIPEMRSMSWEIQLRKAATVAAGLSDTTRNVRAQKLFVGSGKRSRINFPKPSMADRLRKTTECTIVRI